MKISGKLKNKRVVAISSAVIAIIAIITIVGIVTLKDAKHMMQEASQLKTQLKASMQYIKAEDYDSAEDAIIEADQITDELTTELNQPLWKFAANLPFVGKDITSVKELLSIVDEASDEVMKPLIVQLMVYPLSDLKVDDGFNVGLLSAYVDFADDLQPELESLADRIDDIEISLDKDGKLAEYKEMLVSMSESYDDMKEYLPVFKTILGDGSDRLYMLAAQNSSEIRASGGFPGSIGTIRIQDGILTVGDFATPYDVLTDYMPTAANVTQEERTIFGQAFSLLPRDAGFCADFARVAYVWKVAYEAKMDEELDGVISLTPSIIQSALKVLGEITLSDGTVLNGDNATQVLQHDLYFKYLSSNYHLTQANDTADALFSETAQKTMSLFTSKFSLSSAADYLQIFDDGMNDRTIMVWMADEEEENVMIESGCSGVLNTGTDNATAGVYFSSNDSSKMGWFFDLDTQVSTPVKNADGTTTYEVTVTLNNAIDQESIDTGSSYILGTCGGNIRGYVYFFAPTGGTVSDFSMSNGQTITEAEYDGLQVGYNQYIEIEPDTPIVITYNVTTAAGVDTALTLSTTPTLQDYR